MVKLKKYQTTGRIYQGGKKMGKKNNNDRIAHICFLVSSICFYISAIIGIVSKDGSNWVVNLCLGSTFLCLSTTYLNKDEDKNDKEE